MLSLLSQISAQTQKFFKSISNSHISLQSFLLIWSETINTFIRSRSSSKTIPDSRPKWAKCIPVFRPKRRKNPTRYAQPAQQGLGSSGRKRERARTRETRVSPSLARVFSCDHYFKAPATQARYGMGRHIREYPPPSGAADHHDHLGSFRSFKFHLKSSLPWCMLHSKQVNDFFRFNVCSKSGCALRASEQSLSCASNITFWA